MLCQSGWEVLIKLQPATSWKATGKFCWGSDPGTKPSSSSFQKTSLWDIVPTWTCSHFLEAGSLPRWLTHFVIRWLKSRLKIQSKTADGCSAAYGMHHHTTDQLNVLLAEARPVQQPGVFHHITLDFMLALCYPELKSLGSSLGAGDSSTVQEDHPLSFLHRPA